MKKIGLFYATKADKTTWVAEKIQKEFGKDRIEVVPIEQAWQNDFAAYDCFIVGASTWFDGELPTYWDELLPELRTLDLKGKKVAVQGLGNVAYTLCSYLYKEGAKLVVTDINKEAVKRVVDEFSAVAVDPNDIYKQEVDIFSPCALGAIINDQTISQLKAKVIAGSANNQLQHSKHGQMIHEAGFIYAPDYVINAGGVINVADELSGYNRKRAMKRVEGIYDSITKIFEISKDEGIPTYLAANRLAENRINRISKSRSTFLRNDKNILSNR